MFKFDGRLMNMKVLAIVLIFMASAFAQAQPDNFEKEYLDLSDCISIALQRNISLQTAQFNDEIAAADEMSSYQGILPSISAQANKGTIETGPSEYLSNEPVGIDPETGNVIYEQRTRSIAKQSRNQSSANITVSQNIFDGGIWWNQISKSGKDKESAELSYLSERENTILTVKQAYFDLNKQIKLLEANEMAVQRSQAQLDRTDKMFELGATARLDVFRARVNLGNDKITMLNQKNVVKRSRKNLNLVMGRDPLNPLTIKKITDPDIDLPEVDQLYMTAKENQPLLKKYETDVESRQHSVTMAKGVNYPKLSIYFSYDRFHEDLIKVFSDFDKNYQTRYGLNVSVNLFNGFSDYANIQKAEINKRLAQENFEEYKRNLKSAIYQYYQDYLAILDIVEINKQNLEAAKEEVRLAEERYQIGAGTSLEVRESQVNLTRAEQTLIAAQYNALLLVAQLETELGIAFKSMVDVKYE